MAVARKYWAAPHFQSVYRQILKEDREQAQNRFTAMGDKALDVVYRALDCEDPMVALKAADMVLKRVMPERLEVEGSAGGGGIKITEIVVQIPMGAERSINHGDTEDTEKGVIEGEKVIQGETVGESGDKAGEQTDAGWGSLQVVVPGG